MFGHLVHSPGADLLLLPRLLEDSSTVACRLNEVFGGSEADVMCTQTLIAKAECGSLVSYLEQKFEEDSEDVSDFQCTISEEMRRSLISPNGMEEMMSCIDGIKLRRVTSG